MPRVVLALAFSGDGEGLAWVAAGQHVDPSDGGGVELPHVGHDRDSGPVPLEHLSAVRVGFAQPSRLSAELSMDGKVESPDPGEEGAGEHVTRTP